MIKTPKRENETEKDDDHQENGYHDPPGRNKVLRLMSATSPTGPVGT